MKPVSLGRMLTTHDLYAMPEWIALCKAIGIEPKRTTDLIIHVTPSAPVMIYETYQAQVTNQPTWHIEEKEPGDAPKGS